MGKGGKKTDTTSDEKKEVLINGTFYDVTTMKHPGGTIIDFYAGKGIDASQAFNEFHFRSKKVKKYLDNLPNRPAEEKELKANVLPGQEALLADFEKLRRELEAEGMFKPSIPHVIFRITEVIVLHVLGIYLILNNQIPLGIFIMAIGQGRCGWLMHEGGHYSMTGNYSLLFRFPF
jgi:acyl-CoA 6-desaturase (Delta-6 desaturase)